MVWRAVIRRRLRPTITDWRWTFFFFHLIDTKCNLLYCGLVCVFYVVCYWERDWERQIDLCWACWAWILGGYQRIKSIILLLHMYHISGGAKSCLWRVPLRLHSSSCAAGSGFLQLDLNFWMNGQMSGARIQWPCLLCTIPIFTSQVDDCESIWIRLRITPDV